MKVTLFLGSGISYESCQPSVTKITDEILNGKWYEGPKGHFYSGANPNPQSGQSVTFPSQKFLKLLKSKADAYLSRRHCELREDECPNTSNYEDLYFLSEQIANEETREIENAAIEPFVLSLRREIERECPVDSSALADVAQKANCLMKSAVCHFLRKNAAPKGLNLILELAKRDDLTLDIFTLNHDLLIERLLTDSNIAYADGFDLLDGNVTWFNHDSYQDKTKRVRLYKLHGSLNWWRLSSRTNDFRGIAALDDPFKIGWKNAQGDLFCKLDSLPQFLVGSYNKVDVYRYGVYAHIHNAFAATLRDEDVIVMSGYGWNDRGINGWLREWLDDKRKRIVLLHEQPETLVESKSFLRDSYSDLVERKQLDIRIKKFLKDVSAGELIPNLTSP